MWAAHLLSFLRIFLLNFSHLDECWWHEGEKDHRGIAVEPEEILIKRANKFANELKNKNIQSTAIVSHGNFIRALTELNPKIVN